MLGGGHQARPHHLHPAPVAAHGDPQREAHVVGPQGARQGAGKLQQLAGVDRLGGATGSDGSG